MTRPEEENKFGGAGGGNGVGRFSGESTTVLDMIPLRCL